MREKMTCMADGSQHADGKTRRNCNKCAAFKMKLWISTTEKGRLYLEKQIARQSEPMRYAAHYAVRKAIRRGEIPRAKSLICIDCGKKAAVYDHRDYRKPLDVDPVCKSCNWLRGPAKK